MSRFAARLDLAAHDSRTTVAAMALGLVSDTDLALIEQHEGTFGYALAGCSGDVSEAAVATDGPWTALFGGYLLDRPYPESGVQAFLATRGDPDALARLNGVFAGALWNSYERRLILVADRWSTRPLYWACRGSTLAFGSTIRAVVGGAEPDLELDLAAVDDVMHSGWPLPPRTLWRAIRRVPAATMLTWDGAAAPVARRYWTAEITDRQVDLDTYVDGAHEIFTASMRELAARAPNPIVTLSGGFDSRRIAYELVRGGARPAAFTAMAPFSEDLTVDAEVKIARAIAADLKLPLTVVPLPRPATMPDQHRRAESLVAYETGDHEWAPALLDVLPAGRTNFDGLAGDRLLGDYFYELDPERTVSLSTFEICERLAGGTHSGILSEDHERAVPGVFAERLAAILDELPPGPDRVALLYMQTRMPCTIAMYAASVVGSKIESAYPYLDTRLADYVFSFDSSIRRSRDLQEYALARLYPEQVEIPHTHVPYTNFPAAYRTPIGRWYFRQRTHLLRSAARRSLSTPALVEMISPRARNVLHAVAWGAGIPLIGSWLQQRAWFVRRVARIAGAIHAAARWRKQYGQVRSPLLDGVPTS